MMKNNLQLTTMLIVGRFIIWLLIDYCGDNDMRCYAMSRLAQSAMAKKLEAAISELKRYPRDT